MHVTFRLPSTIMLAISLALAIINTAAADVWVGGAEADGEGGAYAGLMGDELGFIIGAVFDSDYSDSEIRDYPVPHSDYTELGKKRIGSLISLDVAYRLLPGRYGSLWIAGGFTFYEESEIARSNITGWLYKQNEDNVIRPDAGVYYHLPVNHSMGIIAGAHTELGGSLGLSFRY